jgi:alpha-ketoglutarate-dependent taurine dioxygenase
MPEPNSFSKPSLLISPIIVEKIKGCDVETSRRWIKKLMNDDILPHRVSIQWRKGDVAIFNNKRFIHSSTPANNYLKNKLNNERFLLQIFIPTKE